MKALCSIDVTQAQWQRFLHLASPLEDGTGERLSGRALTSAEKKQETLSRLYGFDHRVQPWAGTAYGVIQAVNAYEHRERTVRGTERAERNMLRTVTGDFGDTDRTTWRQLTAMLAR